MFGNIGWGEFMILLVAALVILGPERLPGAVSWVTKSLRQVREYASGASNQLKEELGTDFEDLRKPLADLNKLRGMTPRAVITQHLLDGDDSIFTGNFDKKPGGGDKPQSGVQQPTTMSLSKDKPLSAGERPPVDLDAT
ncbi:twin arginine-targeting protein translocase TatB [Rhodococcus sp. SRB_17]|uniref:Sec-independent protein translocase protein TatB n=1 Tax=Rhodococcus sp. OK302 TaxID=1882769 RepID=UPI000B9458FA|nr:Sec-independent protein translocase protein TatB [Rhodococcus sp. OK302]NMM83423.1 twin arginine-targeting protein translocase TatB [Rhodococcus sp. SRB_17]OYD71516.1 sec-independent protein translocase protein TatB [Rhodococcus sp. OK302]